MNESEYDFERAFSGKNSPPGTEFENFWPSESRGDGAIVKNNARTGGAQGKSSLVRKAHCRLCGFPNNLSLIDHSGGSLDGNGAGGAITTGTATTKLNSGATHTENYGQQSYRNGAGCSLCFTKNSSLVRVDVAQNDPWGQRQNTGF